MIWDATDGWIWRTKAAAEYPEDLCNSVAAAYDSHCAEHGMEPMDLDALRTTMTEGGTVDPLDIESRKQRRNRENEEAIGGLRNPHKSIRRIPGWKETGQDGSGVNEDNHTPVVP